jgi:signal transduction histidine kinase
VLELRIEREASFNQRQFMGMVAHEFRTPLAVIMAGLDNLRCSHEFIMHQIRLDRMYRAATRLVQLTDNCLAEARLSSGSLYVEKESGVIGHNKNGGHCC